MGEIIGLLLHNSPILPKSLLLNSGIENFSDEFSAMRESHVMLQWLIKQLHVCLHSHMPVQSMLIIRRVQILNAVPNPNHTTTIVIRHLQDIINRSKEDAIILTLDCEHRYWRLGKKLPPYGIAVLNIRDAIDYKAWDASSSSIRTFYSDISFLFSHGLSVECHRSILAYHLFVLISWISESFLVDGWYLSLYVLCNVYSLDFTGLLLFMAMDMMMRKLMLGLTTCLTVCSGNITY